MTSLYDQAAELATQKFEENEKARNSDAVCVVAIHIPTGEHHAFLSGALGYRELTSSLCSTMAIDKAAAQQRITHAIQVFLQAEEFSHEQIHQKGFDIHGRGAMNCAEPKMYFFLKEQLKHRIAEWVLVPFNWNAQGTGVVYNAPCQNCRRWVYKHFHAQSRQIAQERKGAAAFDLG
ncbi:hypothetical protein SAMN05216603_101267 [Pseudomonas benzenivorans]|nr:hypothetical protein [Pseudomonas benzenivorans]SDG32133.1 hypothetical protein SAMN05216603_101267 [Pseudomonas benzenivorans]